MEETCPTSFFSIFILFYIYLFKLIYCLFVQQCVRVPVVEETCPTEVCFDILVDSLKQVNSFDKEENVSRKN